MAAKQQVDLDRVVDYKAEYCAVIQKFKITGDNLTGLCPFHKDTNNSFSVDLTTGKWHCFSEDEGGNFVSFIAKLKGIDTKEAYRSILEKYGISEETPTPAKKPQQQQPSGLGSYSLDQYSHDKNLPAEWLQSVCRLETARGRDGITWLKIPYFDIKGNEATFRKRFAKKEFRWRYGSGGKIGLYGEWRIPEFKEDGYVVLVEGESDTQSLWRMGIPALGVPGASMFKPEQAPLLQGLKLYIHQEPDKGGETFMLKLTRGLREGGFVGEAYKWCCSGLGAKDPSELYLKHGLESASILVQDTLKAAESVDYAHEDVPEAVAGAPINLRQPEGWLLSDKGISQIEEKKYTPTIVCRTPLILTQRLRSIETGEEKIEIAFKRDDKWQTAIYPRSTIFQSRSITTLSDLGCTITSENSKRVVSFLGQLEAENIDLIPKNDSTSSFGWQPGNRFIPGRAEGITLDIDPTQRGMAAAYCQNGSMANWVQTMTKHRERYKFRFILSAAFAAPLLRIVKQRIFFVYNWGGSKGGKTAALKAALSAWGDPERLMVNFNATQVGLERTAAFYCDLPLGIDERQLAGNNQQSLEKIVYMIASGTGKIRGAKAGGIQTVQQWRTVALATGEEPLSTETSQTGVSTRVLEIYGGPFDDEREASVMHQKAAMDCGWAGPAFVQRVIGIGEPNVCRAFDAMQSYVHAIAGERNGSHIAGVSAVALADAMIDSWFFQTGKTVPPDSAPEAVPEFLLPLGITAQSWQAAKRMAASVMQDQVEGNSGDVNENAVQFIVDWVLSNKAYFGTNTIGTCLGMTSEGGNIVYIFPSVLSQALSKAGYSARKTMKYLADKGLISTYSENNGKKAYSIMRRFGERSCRFVEFFIGKLSEAKDPIDDDDDDPPGRYTPPPYQQTTFTEINDLDEELPF